jgi:hypothetical protein
MVTVGMLAYGVGCVWKLAPQTESIAIDCRWSPPLGVGRDQRKQPWPTVDGFVFDGQSAEGGAQLECCNGLLTKDMIELSVQIAG